MLEAGYGNARDLHRHVRSHTHHALRDRIHEAEGLRRQRRAWSAQQRFLELDQRRLDPLVAEDGKALYGNADRAGLARRVGRQQVGQPGRQQAAVVVVVGSHGGG